jgi:hypothetical protein
VRRAGTGTEQRSRLRVEVTGPGVEVHRLLPRHVASDSDAEVALLYRVPDAIRAAPETRVTYRVELDAADRWSLNGVLGYVEEPHAVRRGWTPGHSGLSTPSVDPTRTRTVRLVRQRGERAA